MKRFRTISHFKKRVLIVDDEDINRQILGNMLGQTYEVDLACDGKEAWDKLNEDGSDYSLILADLLMPVMDGFELIEKVKADPVLKAVPVIVITSDKESEVKSIKLGAADFIKKPFGMPDVILARCERIIELYEDTTIIRSAEKDHVTGLYTRDLFFEYVRQIDVHQRELNMDCVVFNIDHFHLVNEMYGREAGDSILKKVADAITGAMEGHASLACRTEGDSFYLSCEHQDGYEALMDRITETVGSDQGPAKIRLRAGVYLDADRSMDPETMFDRAKLACDRIKGDYTVTVAYYNNELYQKAIYQEHLIENIDQSIENEDFKVYFQPKYDITGDTPKLRSAEALIRWNHPELGMISPGDFIPLFESNGLIQKVDNFVWNKAAACIREWKNKYGYFVPVSVNVSRIDIFDSKLEEKLQNILKNNGITEKDLMLEITESAYSDNADSLTEVTNRLRESGFMIEMDDFGSGYSSLNMITTLPIDVLKLDMKFVRNMEKDEKSLKLVELIIGIAGFLNVPVVAEGVETERQLKKLKDMGCQVIQGYYFSRPVPASEFEEFIKKECV